MNWFGLRMKPDVVGVLQGYREKTIPEFTDEEWEMSMWDHEYTPIVKIGENK